MIELISEDITKVDANVVVLSANPRLIRGGGVSGAIHRAAGPKLEREAVKFGPIAAGSAIITGAFNLSATYIIHAVAPVYIEANQEVESIFSRTYESILRLNRTDAPKQTIVFPAIGSGIYRWPHKKAALLAVEKLRSSPYAKTVVTVTDEENYAAYSSALYT